LARKSPLAGSIAAAHINSPADHQGPDVAAVVRPQVPLDHQPPVPIQGRQRPLTGILGVHDPQHPVSLTLADLLYHHRVTAQAIHRVKESRHFVDEDGVGAGQAGGRQHLLGDKFVAGDGDGLHRVDQWHAHELELADQGQTGIPNLGALSWQHHVRQGGGVLSSCPQTPRRILRPQVIGVNEEPPWLLHMPLPAAAGWGGSRDRER
jgi:hypothetical protein